MAERRAGVFAAALFSTRLPGTHSTGLPRIGWKGSVAPTSATLRFADSDVASCGKRRIRVLTLMLKACSWGLIVTALALGLAMLACASFASYLPLTRTWQRELSAYPPQGGQRWARAIIHMHSVYSHDACDQHPIQAGRI